MFGVGGAVQVVIANVVAALLQVPDRLVVGVPDVGGVLLAGGGAIAVVHKEDGVGG